MAFSHTDVAQGKVLDFGPIGAAEATSELPTYKVQEVSYGVVLTNLDGQAALHLEGKIGANWFTLPETSIIVTGDPASFSGNGLLRYSHCASIKAIRCRLVSASGPLVAVAAVQVMGFKIPD